MTGNELKVKLLLLGHVYDDIRRALLSSTSDPRGCYETLIGLGYDIHVALSEIVSGATIIKTAANICLLGAAIRDHRPAEIDSFCLVLIRELENGRRNLREWSESLCEEYDLLGRPKTFDNIHRPTLQGLIVDISNVIAACAKSFNEDK